MRRDRAVSVTLDYILMLMIATIFLAAAVSISAALIDGQMDRGIEGELRATGEKLAADIQDVERLYNTSNNHPTTLQLTSDLPPHVSGESYQIEIEGGGPMTLREPQSEIEIQVALASDLVISTDGTVRGGTVVISAENGEIEVTEG